MSEQSWIDEHYPIPASEVPIEDALQHSLRKWVGARKENLKKHGVEKPPFRYSSRTCALCCHCCVAGPYVEGGGCAPCPLFKVRGAPCDQRISKGVNPYRLYTMRGDPEPMIELIEAAIELQGGKEETK